MDDFKDTSKWYTLKSRLDKPKDMYWDILSAVIQCILYISIAFMVGYVVYLTL